MDINYLLWLQKIREAAGPVLEMLFYGITMAAFIGVAIAIVIYLCVDKEKGFHVIMAFMIGNLFVQFLKNIFCINRPWVRDSRVTPSRIGIKGATGYSFPSGHSNAAASAYGSLAHQYRHRKVLRIVLIVFVFLIGFSRNYLGVHTPQDVVIGLLIGFGSIWMTEMLIKKYQMHQWSDRTLIILVTLIIAALCAVTLLKSYPMVYQDGELVVDPVKMQRDALQGYGMFEGFSLGRILERRYVHFNTNQISLKNKAGRCVSSIIFVGLAYLLFHNALIQWLDGRICYFLMGFAILFLTMYVMPLLFVKVENRNS